jgi:hypothetical protein
MGHDGHKGVVVSFWHLSTYALCRHAQELVHLRHADSIQSINTNISI